MKFFFSLRYIIVSHVFLSVFFPLFLFLLRSALCDERKNGKTESH
jgi:hypothetical protein